MAVESLPAAPPSAVGLSPERLARVRAWLESHVERRELVGAIAVVARRGRIASFDTVGRLTLERDAPMTDDALFRIASMTKAITTVAVMMLYEEGRFFLDDPIALYLPELESMSVAITPTPPATDTALETVPAERPITIRHLLTHTAGFTYGGGSQRVDPLYTERGLRDWHGDLAGFVREIAEIPLAFQPGTAWEYSYASDLLGPLVERVSGVPFDRFLAERIFQPLRMVDTGFVVAPEDLPRLVDLYQFQEGRLELLESARTTPLREPPRALSAGGGWDDLGSNGGLVSTAADYLRLLQMLLAGGELDGRRLLSRKSVELMLTDHLGGLPTWLGDGVGFGLGFAVLLDLGRYGGLGSPGQAWWAGSCNTFFFLDPREDMIGLLLTQSRPFAHLDMLRRFRVLALQAIDD